MNKKKILLLCVIILVLSLIVFMTIEVVGNYKYFKYSGVYIADTSSITFPYQEEDEYQFMLFPDKTFRWYTVNEGNLILYKSGTYKFTGSKIFFWNGDMTLGGEKIVISVDFSNGILSANYFEAKYSKSPITFVNPIL